MVGPRTSQSFAVYLSSHSQHQVIQAGLYKIEWHDLYGEQMGDHFGHNHCPKRPQLWARAALQSEAQQEESMGN
jgi:hypothetical protein